MNFVRVVGNLFKKAGLYILKHWFTIVTLLCLYIAIEVNVKWGALSYIGVGLARVLRNYIIHKDAIHSNIMMSISALRTAAVSNKIRKQSTNESHQGQSIDVISGHPTEEKEYPDK